MINRMDYSLAVSKYVFDCLEAHVGSSCKNFEVQPIGISSDPSS